VSFFFLSLAEHSHMSKEPFLVPLYRRAFSIRLIDLDVLQLWLGFAPKFSNFKLEDDRFSSITLQLPKESL
jgi:hypothetical protein